MKLQTIFTTTLAVAALGLSSVATATGYDGGNFGGNGGAWDDNPQSQGVNIYRHLKNDYIRMNWRDFQFDVPGQGGTHASDHSVVEESPQLGGSIVRPMSNASNP